MQQDKTLSKVLIGFIVAVLLVSLLVFGFGKNEAGHSGFEVIFNQGFGYIALMVLFALVAAVAIWFAIKQYNRYQEIGKAVVPIIVAIVFIALAFGKGCTDKANDGVTGPGGRPVENVK